jgi:hypothetical protein
MICAAKLARPSGENRTNQPRLEDYMNDEQKRLVKESWRKVVPIAEQVARQFYDRLFESDPTTRPLFQVTNLDEQRRKLIRALVAVVQGLGNLEAIVPVVTDRRSNRGLDRHGRQKSKQLGQAPTRW